jgi:hypothetical protein
MRSRTFLHVSLSILALAAAFHLGARTATAQAPGNPVVGVCLGSGGYFIALTANGDTYDWSPGQGHQWSWDANVFSGGAPTPVQQQSLGALKVRYR